jgi:diketogulonate reductase-like aldo/keto reductase
MTPATATATVPLRSGAAMPLLGLGTWRLAGREAYDTVRYALDVGYRHIDTATMYRNEAEIGRAIGDSGIDRSEVFVTTKLPAQRAGRERQTLARSLHDLSIDQVDLWLIHWPPGGAGVDTWRRLLELRSEGLARDVGVSNYSPGQIGELVAATGEAPAVNQVRWGPTLYDPALLEHCASHGIVLEGYSPFKTSKLDDPVLRAVADRHEVTPAQVVLRWHIEHRVVVIPKSSQHERLESNADVFGFTLDAGEIARIDALAT